jgi:hypothetical protein
MSMTEEKTNRSSMEPFTNRDFYFKEAVDQHLSDFLSIFKKIEINANDLKPTGDEFIGFNLVRDRTFYQSDGSIIILEFDSAGKKNSTIRYFSYAMAASMYNINKNETLVPVTVIVFYTDTNKSEFFIFFYYKFRF